MQRAKDVDQSGLEIRNLRTVLVQVEKQDDRHTKEGSETRDGGSEREARGGQNIVVKE